MEKTVERIRKSMTMSFTIELGNVYLYNSSYGSTLCLKSPDKAKPEDALCLSELIAAARELVDVKDERSLWNDLQERLALNGIDVEVRPLVYRDEKFEVKRNEEQEKKEGEECI